MVKFLSIACISCKILIFFSWLELFDIKFMTTFYFFTLTKLNKCKNQKFNEELKKHLVNIRWLWKNILSSKVGGFTPSYYLSFAKGILYVLDLDRG